MKVSISTILLVLALVLLSPPDSASGQGSQELVRVKRGANLHKGPNTQPEVLFMLPEGTVLSVIERVGRNGVWIAVRITPEVRQRATRMRWRNEDRGYVHQSTIEVVKPGSQ
jgi:hypothetical protein